MKVNEILKKYNISDATLRNWKKLRYIDSLDDIDPDIIDGILQKKIGNRRNKRNSSDYIISVSYINDKKIVGIINSILELKKKYNVSAYEILHETIIKIIEQNNKKVPDCISDFLGVRTNNSDFLNDFKNLQIVYDEKNDFLGCLYMALLSVGKKDTNGIYYTPYKVVNKIVESIDFKENKKIVDPGCGSGNFLIQTFNKMKNKGIPVDTIIENLYGFDIDNIAVLLAKTNIYIQDSTIIFDNINIYNKDFLNDDIDMSFDVIIGNPPWGKKYTTEEKNIIKEKYNLAFSKMDSFSQFILHSFDLLNNDGILGFVLPSSILNIAIHENIRKFLLNNKIEYIKKIGREFEEIVTDVIIIKVIKTSGNENKCIYDDIIINQNDFSQNPYSNFLVSDTISSSIIEKLKTHKHYNLDQNVNYALGIVTGDNKEYLFDRKKKGTEPIISGKDIKKYKIDYSNISKYIKYERENFQQVANDSLYRHENKIIYKFIGKKLCFAIDRRKTLTLNSANIICLGSNYNINYISAILNSRITQLYFEDAYNTHKVLKSHIESFYIPEFDDSITNTISDIVGNLNPQETYCEEIEDIIYHNLGLTQQEIEYLRNRF